MIGSHTDAAVAGVVDRPRLYDVLDSPLVRVCVVQGPSGSGKTTLLRSWALLQEHKPTWVPLSEGGLSRQAFWRHVIGAARRLGEISEGSVENVGEQLALSTDPVEIAASLLADAGQVTLIIDGYEHLGDAMAQVDADLIALVATLPKLRLLVTTRGRTALADVDPPRGVVRVVTLNELAMTHAEVGVLIERQTGLVDDALAGDVARATRGFPLTVRAVALALSQLGRIPNVGSMEWDAIVAARWEALLPDEVAVRFVTDTSIPPYVDVELAEQLTGHPGAKELLDELERQGFGRWIPYTYDIAVFKYAETIRGTFRARAGLESKRFCSGCVTTATWLLGHDAVDQALIFAIEGGDYALADRVFLSLVIDNPDSYITDRFLPTLRKVPEAVLSEHPLLAFGLGLSLAANPMLRLEAPRAFRIAIASTARPQYVHPEIDDFTLAAMRAVAHRVAFEFRESAEAAQQVVHALDALPIDLVALHGEQVGTSLRQVSYSLLQGGFVDQAIATAMRSVALCRTPAARNYSTVYAAGASAFAGDVVGARNFMARLEFEAWPEELRRSYLNGMGVVADAYDRLDQLDFAGAAEALQATRTYTPIGEFWPFFTAISISARHGLGQALPEAERVARELAGPTPPGVGHNAATESLHAALARAWMAGGEHATAARLLDDTAPDRPLLAAARVSRLLAEGRDRDAFELAERAVALPRHTLRSLADLRTVGAVAAMREGKRALAWLWLNGAAVTWESSRTRLHVATLPTRDRRLLWELANAHGSLSVQRYLDVPSMAGQARASVSVTLTAREEVVLRAMAEHDSTRSIAAALVVSPHTIKTQLHGLYRKFGVSSRHAAVAVARDLGLLGPDGSSSRDQVPTQRDE